MAGREGRRVAEARARPHPHGTELVLLMDGQLLWTELFKHGRGVALGERPNRSGRTAGVGAMTPWHVLGEIAEAKRREFLGWRESS